MAYIQRAYYLRLTAIDLPFLLYMRAPGIILCLYCKATAAVLAPCQISESTPTSSLVSTVAQSCSVVLKCSEQMIHYLLSTLTYNGELSCNVVTYLLFSFIVTNQPIDQSWLFLLPHKYPTWCSSHGIYTSYGAWLLIRYNARCSFLSAVYLRDKIPF